jgi:hypothetical protein
MSENIVNKIMGKGKKIGSEPKINVPKGTTKVPSLKGNMNPTVPKGIDMPKPWKKSK